MLIFLQLIIIQMNTRIILYTIMKKINKMIFVFNSTNTNDYYKSFNTNKFNILDYNYNYILNDIELDEPLCNANVNDNNDKRDNITTGKYNPMLKEYIIYDNDEYTEFKNNNNLNNYKKLKNIQKYYNQFVCENPDKKCEEYKNNLKSKLELFQGYINNKYNVLNEHFTNEIENKFNEDKYIKYRK